MLVRVIVEPVLDIFSDTRGGSDVTVGNHDAQILRRSGFPGKIAPSVVEVEPGRRVSPSKHPAHGSQLTLRIIAESAVNIEHAGPPDKFSIAKLVLINQPSDDVVTNQSHEMAHLLRCPPSSVGLGRRHLDRGSSDMGRGPSGNRQLFGTRGPTSPGGVGLVVAVSPPGGGMRDFAMLRPSEAQAGLS